MKRPGVVVVAVLIGASACSDPERQPSGANRRADAGLGRDAGISDGAIEDVFDASLVDGAPSTDGSQEDTSVRDLGVPTPIDAGFDAGLDSGCAPGSWPAVQVDFDDAPGGTLLGRRYLPQGVRLTRVGGEPVSFTVFDSPASPPAYATGDDEATDTNPGNEWGNNQPALTISVRFVDPADETRRAVTAQVSIVAIFVNDMSQVRLEAYDVDGIHVGAVDQTGVVGMFAIPMSISAPGIHEVRVLFDPSATGQPFEDNAGIDDLVTGPLSTSCP